VDRQRTLWILGLLVIVLIAGGVLLASRMSGDPAPSSHESQKMDSGSWQAQLVHRADLLSPGSGWSIPWPFAGLKGHPEEMSTDFRRAASITVGGAQLGLRFGQAQFIRTQGEVGVWLVKGSKVACIFEAESVVGACNTGLDIARKGLILVTSRETPPRGKLPEHFLGVGIAPDWAKAVQLRVGPQLETIPITNNVYSIQARDPIDFEGLIR
jgi:hypothetical protein